MFCVWWGTCKFPWFGLSLAVALALLWLVSLQFLTIMSVAAHVHVIDLGTSVVRFDFLLLSVSSYAGGWVSVSHESQREIAIV